MECLNVLYKGREIVLNAFKSGIIPLKSAQGKRIKMLTHKQILQRLPVVLSQVIHHKIYQMKYFKLCILCIKQNKLNIM